METTTTIEQAAERFPRDFGRGQADAQLHAHQESFIKPGKSILQDYDYAARMASAAFGDGTPNDEQRAAYWAGYYTESLRLDPNKTKRPL